MTYRKHQNSTQTSIDWPRDIKIKKSQFGQNLNLCFPTNFWCSRDISRTSESDSSFWCYQDVLGHHGSEHCLEHSLKHSVSGICHGHHFRMSVLRNNLSLLKILSSVWFIRKHRCTINSLNSFVGPGFALVTYLKKLYNAIVQLQLLWNSYWYNIDLWDEFQRLPSLNHFSASSCPRHRKLSLKIKDNCKKYQYISCVDVNSLSTGCHSTSLMNVTTDLTPVSQYAPRTSGCNFEKW